VLYGGLISETDIVKSILEYLTLRRFLCKRNNAGMMYGKSTKGKSWAVKIGEAGWPDIEGITKDGRYFGVEVKTKKGRLSPAQKEVGEKIIESKGIWFVARSVDDVIQAGF